MVYSECLPTRLNPLAERTCFPQARMLATIQQRPLEITFSDRCSVAMEEFNPWGDEQHDDPVRLHEGELTRIG